MKEVALKKLAATIKVYLWVLVVVTFAGAVGRSIEYAYDRGPTDVAGLAGWLILFITMLLSLTRFLAQERRIRKSEVKK